MIAIISLLASATGTPEALQSVGPIVGTTVEPTNLASTATDSLRRILPDGDASLAIDAMKSEYIQILEKTNQQLSLWLNPYGVMVGALGVLFAILAVVATVLIWRQSEDHKKTVQKSIDEQEKLMKALFKSEVEAMENRVFAQIEDQNSKQQKDSEERREEIHYKFETLQNDLRKLKRLRNARALYTSGGLTDEDWDKFYEEIKTPRDIQRVCVVCGKAFLFSPDDGGLREVDFSDPEVFVECTHCGTSQSLESDAYFTE